MTQLEKVKYILDRDGEITRNQCLRMYISRLSSYMLKLKRLGYEYTTSRRNGDYVYTLTHGKKAYKYEIRVKNGERVAVKVPL